MKRFYGVILMLVMFIGAIGSPGIDNLVKETVITVPQTITNNPDVDVMDFISDWVGDNFSSECGPDALLPNTLGIYTVKRNGGLCLLDGEIPFLLLFEFKDNKIKLSAFDKDNQVTLAENKLAQVILARFTKDFNQWSDRVQ